MMITTAVLGIVLAAAHAAPRHHAPSAPLVRQQPIRARPHSALRVVEDEARARAALARLASRYRYLDGVTVVHGATPNGEEAVAYYTEGRIVINTAHTLDEATILAHEVWHIIDWRDNGALDWGERIPASGADTYLKHPGASSR
jgi:hypothetical protein